MIKKVAIQGFKGSYHHEAVGKFFPLEEVELLECETFKQLAKAVHKKEVHTAVMAIENTIAGAILPNYELISRYKLKVVGEVYLSIQHQLMALSGESLESIKEVRSHQMALLQCDKFLEKNLNWKIVEAVDTALTAKEIAENKWHGVAAIASKKAAEVYGLDILKSSIQTFPHNFTRFFILENNAKEVENFDKASLRFVTDHEKGALLNVIKEISERGINMDKIQSVPIIHQPWNYSFHVDLTFDTTDQYFDMLHAIEMKTTEIEILGEYKSGIKEEYLANEENDHNRQ